METFCTIINSFLFDWNSFWINIIAGAIFFILSTLISIWLIPRFTLRLINRKNRKFIIRKQSALILELCEFLMNSPFKDDLLNRETLAIFTKKSDTKNYRFVGLSVINVFNNLIYPQITIVILNLLKKTEPNIAYELITSEHKRLKDFRKEIEKIIAYHSLHLDQEIILKISDLCFEIRNQEIQFSTNAIYDDLLTKTNSERTMSFGIIELPKIYEQIFYLLRHISSLPCFEFEIKRKT